MKEIIHDKALEEMGLVNKTGSHARNESSSEEVRTPTSIQTKPLFIPNIRSIAQHISKPNPMNAARMFLTNKYNSTSDEPRMRWWRGEFWLWDGKKYSTWDASVLRAEVMRFFD
ncbi:MAG: hypothetical protein IIB00_02265, partial [candidate division Zixibacteria bacterium]|nr:hypothetical protein [candidate division Zixibacteria bacterium]